MTSTRTRVAALAAIATLLGPTPALADGGKSIAQATPVVYGQQMFGNTATATPTDDETYRSWWSLDVDAGDRVRIDWEAQDPWTELYLFPVGTTDYSLADTYRSARDSLSENRMSQLVFVAPSTGSMPLGFVANADSQVGPYAFTAYVEHALRLALGRSPVRPASGSIAVAVRSPEGAPINDGNLLVTLQVKRRDGSAFRAIGTTSVASGLATITYSVPARLRNRKVVVRAIAAGTGYISQASSKQRTVFR